MPSEWVVLVHHDGGGMSAARAARGQERLTGVAALLLLLVVAVGLLGQGGYYGPVQRLVGLLVAAATLLAMVARPRTATTPACSRSSRRWPWSPGRWPTPCCSGCRRPTGSGWPRP
jgi:hypothetical protein